MPRPAALLVAVALAGCADGPSAPPLAGGAVYQSTAAGVRFLAPDGWQMVSRAEPPPGPLPGPVVLVSYLDPSGDQPGEFELVAADLPNEADLGAFLAGYRIGGEKWEPRGAGGELTAVGGDVATRYEYARGKKKAEARREVTAVRRGGRVLFFVVTFGASDPAHRDQARKSVQSVTWTGTP